MKANDSSSTTQSGSKLNIIRRHVNFNYQDIQNNHFCAENAIISAFWVGLSATFPLGENEFIQAVKLFEKGISDPKLKAEVADFSAQEAHHSFQHRKLNKHFDSQGFNTTKIEDYMNFIMANRRITWSPKKRLMRTVAAEHITAVIAHYILSHPDALQAVPDSFRNLFLWHSVEEIEHKSVAFDVYQNCVGDMSALKRHYAAFAFIEFPIKLIKITCFLLKEQQHKSSWAERKNMFQYLFGRSGMISSVKHLYWMFLKSGFHPWQHDDSSLIEQWKYKLDPNFKTTEKKQVSDTA